jgi:iron complex outermembrane receptor protein
MPKTPIQALSSQNGSGSGLISSGQPCTTLLGRHTNWRNRFAPLAGFYRAGGVAAAHALAADSSEQEPTLKSVTVTATRREESLQKVPVAVSVIDGEQLERDNRNGVASIVQQVPSLNFRTGASNKDTSLFVRGSARFPPRPASSQRWPR